jgi:hypothetical protein
MTALPHSGMLRRLFAVALAFAPLGALAYGEKDEHPCPQGHLPAVCCFEPTEDGFVASLCGLYSRQWDVVDHPNTEERTIWTESREVERPWAEFRRKSGWRWLEPRAASSCSYQLGAASNTRYGPPAGAGQVAPGCPQALATALPRLTQADFKGLRPRAHGNGAGKQEVGACVEHGGYVWFGLAFYDGEGDTGVGGLGRFDPKTEHVEIRRPRVLRDWSSAALLHDGRWLWLATYAYEEYGDHPAIGVVRYDWASHRVVPEADGMCGFLVRGMVKLGDVLWLASDGGLSRRTGDGPWEHLVFRVGESPAVERTNCRALYELARATAGKDDPFDRDVRAYRAMRERARSAARATGAGR